MYDKKAEKTEYVKIDNIFNISKNIPEKRTYNYQPHYHNICEIYYYMKGKATLITNNESHVLEKGDIAFFNAYEVHNLIYLPYEYERVIIQYKPSFLKLNSKISIPDIFSILDNNHNRTRLISLPANLHEKIDSIVKDLLVHSNSSRKYDPIYQYTEFILFMIHLAEYLDSFNTPEKFTTDSQKRISEIAQFINSYYSENLSLDILSKEFAINKYELCRLFKEHMRVTVNKYINQIRITIAESMLLKEKYSVTEISQRVGYNNLTHFERVFRSINGNSPRVFINENIAKYKK